MSISSSNNKRGAATPATPQESGDTNAIVGQRVKARRLALKMSQSDLGSMAGISFQQVQKYERGINRLSIPMLQKFANALQAPLTHFLPEVESGAAYGLASGSSQDGFEAPAGRGIEELVRLYNDITNPDSRKQLLKLAQQLADDSSKQAQADADDKAKPKKK